MKETAIKLWKSSPPLLLVVIIVVGGYVCNFIYEDLKVTKNDVKEVKEQVNEIRIDIVRLGLMIEFSQQLTSHSIKQNMDSLQMIASQLNDLNRIATKIPYKVSVKTQEQADTVVDRVERLIVENKPDIGLFKRNSFHNNKEYDFNYYK